MAIGIKIAQHISLKMSSPVKKVKSFLRTRYDTGQKYTFSKSELRRSFSKIVAGGFGNPIDIITPLDNIEINLIHPLFTYLLRTLH
ncbi:hypothetical protein D3C81_1259600 [compost metagenome]